jgi:hypothetical protein
VITPTGIGDAWHRARHALAIIQGARESAARARRWARFARSLRDREPECDA